MKKYFSAFLTFCLAGFFCFAEDSVRVLKMSDFPPSIPKAMAEKINGSAEFWKELEDIIKTDGIGMFILVDKKNPLPDNYAPKNLINLKTKASYILNKNGMQLTAQAERALEKMASAAKKDGINLLVSSAYRSFEYQKNLFKRYSKEYGEEKAETFSARPESTQHRLGTVVDFGSISDEYAETKAGKWLYKNAEKYGWSLSYPKGMENITGYKWECWHYRYLGENSCTFQKKWFGNVQQYMLEFIDKWLSVNKLK